MIRTLLLLMFLSGCASTGGIPTDFAEHRDARLRHGGCWSRQCPGGMGEGYAELRSAHRFQWLHHRLRIGNHDCTAPSQAVKPVFQRLVEAAGAILMAGAAIVVVVLLASECSTS
jgi:hypothetical protein